MKTRSFLALLLGLLLVLALGSCAPTPDGTEQPSLPTLTARPPKPTKTVLAAPANPTQGQPPVITRTLPNLPAPSQPAPRPTRTTSTSSNARVPTAGETFEYKISETAIDIGIINYAFITDYGYHTFFFAGGGMLWMRATEAGYEAFFSSPVDFVAGNNITTRDSDDSILVADYSPQQSGKVTLYEKDFNGDFNLVKTINEQMLTVITLEFSADGMILAIGYNTGEIRLYDTEGGSLLRSIQAHIDDVTSMAFSYDGRYLVSDSWSNDPNTYVFETSSGQKVTTLSTESYEPGIVAFSQDGSRVAATASDGTHIYSTSNWSPVGVVIPGVWGGSFTCDSQMLMVSYGEGLTEFYSIDSGQKVGEIGIAPIYCTYRYNWDTNTSYWELSSLLTDPNRNIVTSTTYTP